MQAADYAILIPSLGLAGILFFQHARIRRAIEDFTNNFPRGGPPTPTHPSPADDDRFLRKKRRLTAPR